MTETAPYQNHSDPSQAAAKAVEPRLGTLHRQVHGYLERRGPSGATDDEIAIDLGMKQSTARPRRVELVRAGKVKDSGRTRKTSTGAKAAVWVACDEAPQPQGAPLRGSALRKAAEPFVIRARALLEDPIVAGAHDETQLGLRIRITPGQLKALIQAWEG